jgi:peptide deformylase
MRYSESMAIRKIMRMGHPVLRRRARTLTDEEIGSERLRLLVDDMVDTLHDYGGIGLAAPQVGESIRLAIIEITDAASRYGEIPTLPLSVFINPEIEVLDPATRGYWEGCLSVPGLRGFVERPQNVRVRYTGADGEPGTLELEGFLATVFQHEFDHLDGKLYIDRLADPKLLSFEEEFLRYAAPRENDDDDGAEEHSQAPSANAAR